MNNTSNQQQSQYQLPQQYQYPQYAQYQQPRSYQPTPNYNYFHQDGSNSQWNDYYRGLVASYNSERGKTRVISSNPHSRPYQTPQVPPSAYNPSSQTSPSYPPPSSYHHAPSRSNNNGSQLNRSPSLSNGHSSSLQNELKVPKNSILTQYPAMVIKRDDRKSESGASPSDKNDILQYNIRGGRSSISTLIRPGRQSNNDVVDAFMSDYEPSSYSYGPSPSITRPTPSQQEYIPPRRSNARKTPAGYSQIDSISLSNCISHYY